MLCVGGQQKGTIYNCYSNRNLITLAEFCYFINIQLVGRTNDARRKGTKSKRAKGKSRAGKVEDEEEEKIMRRN